MFAHLIIALLLASPARPDPVVILDRDDFPVTRSCQVLIPKGKVFRDLNGNGVVHIKTPGITVSFDGTLRGSPSGTDPDRYEGVGIRLVNVAGVTVTGARVSGFKVGVHATGADGLVFEKAVLDDNFRQRLLSTPMAEESSDWLRPHENDDHEWIKKYGAALYVERCAGSVIREVEVRRGQNGIVLDRVNASEIYDNDASFLSGWGLAMWRSNRNTVSKNAFDFCIRGYSHLVYNRGQDSAGILMFEQCSNNVFLENSCTHGGDGIFGFAGEEALSGTAALGNNDNVFKDNDLSYAAAHGLEMTFSFRNLIRDNRFIENAICGIWGGYSQDTWIIRNDFEKNGDMAYGLERGGINIEHGYRNRIVMNRFRNNRCGIHLWDDDDKHLLTRPWAVANHKGCRQNLIYQNRFTGDRIAVHLRGAKETYYTRSTIRNVETEIRKDDASQLIEATESGPEHPRITAKAIGKAKPIGARKSLRGRRNIVMDTWGPWNHEAPLVRLHKSHAGEHVWDLFKVDGDITPDVAGAGVSASLGDGTGLGPGDADGVRKLTVRASTPGVHGYRVTIKAGAFTGIAEGTLLNVEWTVRVFPWTKDPREDMEGWLAESKTGAARTAVLGHLQLKYANAGPSEARLSDEITAAKMSGDRFGTIAAATVPLTKGTWTVKTLSDDGIRVKVDGKTVIDDWTWHGPKPHAGSFVVEKDGDVSLEVMHFEIDGFSVLTLELERETP